MVLDLDEDDRGGDNKRASEHAPSGTKEGVVLDLETIEAPEDGRTSGLDTLVEASQIGSLATRVGESAHVPVDARLPDSIVETVKEVEENGAESLAAGVGPVQLADLVRIGFVIEIGTGVLLLLPGPATAPDNKG